MKPKISIIICTYNGENLIRRCLDSILNQDYRDFEILCLDGMSSDNTQKIIKEYSQKDKRVKLIINKNRLPEGKGYGKWLGYKNARGEIVGFIDQDNCIQTNKILASVEKIFSRHSDLIGILGGLKHEKSDEKIIRYVALFGTDSFFAYRSLDFLRHIKKPMEEKVGEKTYEIFPMSLDNMSLTGGNCFFYKKKDIESIGGFDQDVLVVKKLLKFGKRNIAVVKDATKHYAEESLFRLAKKKFFWGKSFSERKQEEKFDYLPKTTKENISFVKNILFNLLLLPNLFYSVKIYNKSGDLISFAFPLMAFLNTIAYGVNFAKMKFKF